jgi:hypothetical protein
MSILFAEKEERKTVRVRLLIPEILNHFLLRKPLPVPFNSRQVPQQIPQRLPEVFPNDGLEPAGGEEGEEGFKFGEKVSGVGGVERVKGKQKGEDESAVKREK